MPRSSLPNITAKMRTIEVMLTKTTEETIWTHLQNKMVGLEDKIDEYSNRLNELTNLYFHTNPYDKYTIKDWRENRPKMKYNLDRLRWISDLGEEYSKEYFDMLEVITDIRICNKAFPEWNERLSDIMEVIEFLKFDTTELITWERIKFYKSKEKYEKEDVEYIAEQKLLRNHRESHLTRERFLTNEFYRRVMYEGKEPEYWTTCKWCISHEKMLQDIKDAEAEQERIIQQEIKKHEEKKRQERAERVASIEYHTCECCDYKTSNIDAYDRHLESKEHRVKQNHIDWFCECCNTQSRSKNEHEFHLKSNKHQQNAGLITDEIKMFRCECCDYETARKDYYKLHLGSKKHIKNSAEK